MFVSVLREKLALPARKKTFDEYRHCCFAVDSPHEIAAIQAKGLAIGQESSDEEKARVKSGEFQLVLFSPEALRSVRRCSYRDICTALESLLLSLMRRTVSRNGVCVCACARVCRRVRGGWV